MLPLNWLTLRSSIRICIALVDHVIHGYNHFKGALNYRYAKNATCIDFIIQDTMIKAIIEGRNWIICDTCLLSWKLLVSSANFLNRYSDIFYFSRKGEVWNSSKWNFITVLEEGKNPWIVSVIWFHLVFIIVLRRKSSLLSWDLSPALFNSGSSISVSYGIMMCTS